MIFPIQQGTLTVGREAKPLIFQPMGRNVSIKVRSSSDIWIGNREVTTNGNNVGFMSAANTTETITFASQHIPLFFIANDEGAEVSYLITALN